MNRRITGLPLALVLALAAACSAPSSRAGGGDPAASAAADTLTLADPYAFGDFSPINAYGEMGITPFYDGLYRPRPSAVGAVPELEPALATAAPQGSADGRTWTVPLRSGVTFHDGTTFGPEDVVATYSAIIDPAKASTGAADFGMLQKVEAKDGKVVFHLAYPYADFPTLLTQSIGPSELVGQGTAAEGPLNTKPVGTGPYKLASLTADRMVLEANEHYFGGAPALKKVVRVHAEDDNARAQRMSAGEVDGTVLPPALAASLDGKNGLSVVVAKSHDWRAVTLPKSAFAADPKVRRAMNLAVDREAMIKTVLAGKGSSASFPLTKAFGDMYDAGAQLGYDKAAAEKLLDEAGWVKGPDGTRRKGAERASFPLLYSAADTIRRDLAVAFASEMKKVGIEVTLEGSTWDKIKPRLGKVGLLQGGGSRPYSADSLVYEALHRRTGKTSSPYSNSADFGSAQMDAALEKGRTATDPATRAKAYREVQRLYAQDPHAVYLAFLEHTYVTRNTGWKGSGQLILEPHGHDVSFGPWWDIESWRR